MVTVMRRNLALFPYFEFARSLIFTIPIWVAYKRQFISGSELIFLEGVLLGSQLILELPTGAFADLLGKRASVALGFFAIALAYVLYAFATNFQMFLVTALLTGLGEALISGAKEALLYDTLKEAGEEDRFSKVNARLEIIFQVGIGLATLVGGVLGSIDLRIPIWLYVGAMAATGVIALGFREPFIDTEKFTLKRYVKQNREGFREIHKTPYIWQISLFYVLVGAVSWSCMLAFNVMVLTDIGYTPIQLGITVALMRVVNSFVLFRLINVGNLIRKHNVFLFFPILLIAALIPGIWLTKWVAIPFVAASMFASTARWVLLSKYTNEHFDSRKRATAISSLSMLIGVLYVLFMVGLGPVIDWWGDARIIYTVLGVFSALTILPLGIRLTKAHGSAR